MIHGKADFTPRVSWTPADQTLRWPAHSSQPPACPQAPDGRHCIVTRFDSLGLYEHCVHCGGKLRRI